MKGQKAGSATGHRKGNYEIIGGWVNGGQLMNMDTLQVDEDQANGVAYKLVKLANWPFGDQAQHRNTLKGTFGQYQYVQIGMHLTNY